MTARAPAGSTVQKCGVIEIADKDLTRRGLLLEMAAQAKRLIARNEQSGIHAPVRVVACRATFA